MIVNRFAFFSRIGHFAAIFVLALAGNACGKTAAPPATGALHAERAWIRATPPNARVAGGYLTLRNTGATPDRLVSVSSDAAAVVEIHEMRMDGGTMKMRELRDGVAVPAGGIVELKPGAIHLMFIGPRRDFKAGDQVEATLLFARGRRQDITFAIQPLGAMAAPGMTMEGQDNDGGHAHH